MNNKSSRPPTEIQPVADVRGVSVLNIPANFFLRAIAFFVDLAAVIAVFSYSWSLVDSVWLVFLILVLSLSLWFAQLYFFGGTIGHFVWHLRILNFEDHQKPRTFSERFHAKVFQKHKLGFREIVTGIFLTLSIIAVSSYLAFEHVFSHPLFIRASTVDLAPFTPEEVTNNAENRASVKWKITPFFYSLGAWPSSFGGKPVFYQLPYQKGPPLYFVGGIVARWELPDIKVTIEGPRTPGARDRNPKNIENRFSRREQIQSCLTAEFVKMGPKCFKSRKEALGRHIEEIRKAVKPQRWNIKWFKVNNPALPADEAPQGIFISGENENIAQDRYIFITALGAHQAVILDRPMNDRGDFARVVLEETIRSQRLSDSLISGRSWINRELVVTNLEEIGTKNESILENLSEVHLLLLSKISVDPQTFDSYYHLGGTAWMLLKLSIEQKNPELSAIAKPMIESAFRYAQDIAPKDSKTVKLQDIWLEARKLY